MQQHLALNPFPDEFAAHGIPGFLAVIAQEGHVIGHVPLPKRGTPDTDIAGQLVNPDSRECLELLLVLEAIDGFLEDVFLYAPDELYECFHNKNPLTFSIQDSHFLRE